MAEGRVAGEGGRDGYHCAAEIPDVLSNNQPSDCTVGALPPPLSVPSLSPRWPVASHHRLTWQLAAWLFHNGEGRERGEELEGERRRGSCVVITGDIIIEEGTNALWELANTLVRGKTNQGCNSQIIHQPEILLPETELQLHSC